MTKKPTKGYSIKKSKAPKISFADFAKEVVKSQTAGDRSTQGKVDKSLAHLEKALSTSGQRDVVVDMINNWIQRRGLRDGSKVIDYHDLDELSGLIHALIGRAEAECEAEFDKEIERNLAEVNDSRATICQLENELLSHNNKVVELLNERDKLKAENAKLKEQNKELMEMDTAKAELLLELKASERERCVKAWVEELEKQFSYGDEETCYMLEIEPRYCDVVLQRWENLTNQKAEKIKK